MSLALARCCLATRTQLFYSSPVHRASPWVAAGKRRQALRPASGVSVRVMSASGGSTDFAALVQQKNVENAVMVYSKTYCPYCTEVKSLFQRLGVPAKVVELDDLADGSKVQEALTDVTGSRTVPQVFIGGQHVGGCDATVAAMNSGKLKQMLEAAGVQAQL